MIAPLAVYISLKGTLRKPRVPLESGLTLETLLLIEVRLDCLKCVEDLFARSILHVKITVKRPSAAALTSLERIPSASIKRLYPEDTDTAAATTTIITTAKYPDIMVPLQGYPHI